MRRLSGSGGFVSWEGLQQATAELLLPHGLRCCAAVEPRQRGHVPALCTDVHEARLLVGVEEEDDKVITRFSIDQGLGGMARHLPVLGATILQPRSRSSVSPPCSSSSRAKTITASLH